MGYREGDAPSYTVTALARPSHVLPRAFVVEGSCKGRGRMPRPRSPANQTSLATATARAVVVGSNSFTLPIRAATEPIFTIKASGDKAVTRALLVDCTHRTDGDLTVREACNPSFTVTASAMRREANAARGLLAQDRGRVVRMSVRALARFQTMPDSYQFSDKLAQDCAVIGDGVPCLLAEAFGRQIVKLFA